MAEPARRLGPATYDDVLAAPEHMVAELIDGLLLKSPRPRPRHAACAASLGADLNVLYHRPLREGDEGPPGGWWILFEQELHLGLNLGRRRATDIVLVPDIAGWRRERMPVFPYDELGIDVAPDWACEVLSPTTSRNDRLRKLGLYAASGVEHVWLVDAAARSIEVYRAVEGLPALVGGYLAEEGAAPEVSLPPFADAALDSTRWW